MFALRRFAPSLSASSARAFSSSPSSQAAKLTLVGRLARQAEIKTSTRGEEFIVYTIATKDGPKQDAPVSFYNVSKFQLTEATKNLLLSLPKGTLMHIGADVSHHRKEGEQNPRLLLRQRDMEILGKPRPREDGEQNNGEQNNGEQNNGEQY